MSNNKPSISTYEDCILDTNHHKNAEGEAVCFLNNKVCYIKDSKDYDWVKGEAHTIFVVAELDRSFIAYFSYENAKNSFKKVSTEKVEKKQKVQKPTKVISVEVDEPIKEEKVVEQVKEPVQEKIDFVNKVNCAELNKINMIKLINQKNVEYTIIGTTCIKNEIIYSILWKRIK